MSDPIVFPLSGALDVGKYIVVTTGGQAVFLPAPTTPKAAGVDVGVTGDTPLSIPFSRYIVRHLTITNASVNLAATTATIGLYTAASGGGVVVVAPSLLTSLIATGVTLDLALALSATALDVPTLYIRVVQGPSPVPGTIDAIIELTPL